jgi:ribonuclease D
VNKDLILIDDIPALAKFCTELQGNNWLALDTEFERVKTYYPELCLLQLCNGTITALVDPLEIEDLEPLYELLYDKTITKVFHAARQDLELFFHIKGQIPVPLFDTQIAAGILGYDSQIGYAKLINEVLGVELAKTETRTNWKRRPLSREQLIYAADDVIYLARIYQKFIASLKTSAQLSVMDEEFKALTRPDLYEPDPETMWQKIKIARNLKGESLAVLKKLAAWRELTARKENQPRKWILGDHALLELAKLRPTNLDALSQVKGMKDELLKRHGLVLLEVIN